MLNIKVLLTILFLAFAIVPVTQAQQYLSNTDAKPETEDASPVPKMTFGSKRLAKKLLKATLADDHAKMKKLLEKGADINLPVKGKYGHTTSLGKCFSYISNCSESTIKLLLGNGADVKKLIAVNFKAGSKWRPIHSIITRAISQSIDRGNYSRFKLLASLYQNIDLSSVARMKLYGCYGTESIGISCGSKNSKWPKDLKVARRHLEDAVRVFAGKTHDGRLNSSSDPRYRLAMDLHSALRTWATQANHKDDVKAAWPIADAIPYCEQAVEWLKPDAENENKLDCTSRSQYSFWYCNDGSGKKFGTGSGYSKIRRLLDDCLYYTKDHETWERLLKTRMDYFSLRADVSGNKSWLLSHAESRYKKNNNANAARILANWRKEAVAEAAILKKNNWDPTDKSNFEQLQRKEAAKQRQDRADEIAGQRRWKELQEWSAQSDREQKKAWANSKSQDDQFWSNIKKTERQTMDNINANKLRMQKSRASSTSSSKSSSSNQYRQQLNSQLNNNSKQKEQCPSKPLGKFNPQKQDGVGTDQWREEVKESHRKWRNSLSPYCKSQTPTADSLFKSGSGSGIRK